MISGYWIPLYTIVLSIFTRNSFIDILKFSKLSNLVTSILVIFCMVTLTTRNLFRPKNIILKLFKKFNFYSMFMCKTRMMVRITWLWGPLAISRIQNRKIRTMTSKVDIMMEQYKTFQFRRSSRSAEIVTCKFYFFFLKNCRKMSISWTNNLNFEI